MKLTRFNNGHRQQPTTTNSIFDNFFNEDFFKPFYTDRPAFQTRPSVNIVELADVFRIEVAAPGLVKDDFKVNLDKETLTISVTKETAQTEETESYKHREFNYASFERSFRLPKSIDTANISGKYENGVLTVTLPKLEEAKEKPARDIAID